MDFYINYIIISSLDNVNSIFLPSLKKIEENRSLPFYLNVSCNQIPDVLNFVAFTISQGFSHKTPCPSRMPITTSHNHGLWTRLLTLGIIQLDRLVYNCRGSLFSCATAAVVLPYTMNRQNTQCGVSACVNIDVGGDGSNKKICMHPCLWCLSPLVRRVQVAPSFGVTMVHWGYSGSSSKGIYV